VQPKDYVLLRLTGELATDAYSWRGLLRLPDGTAPQALLDELDLPSDLVAPVLPPDRVVGGVREAAAAALHIASGTPVVVGWHDLSCALLGAGVTRSEQGFDIGGTSEHVGVSLADRPGSVTRRHAMRSVILGPYLARQPGIGDAAPAHVLYGVTSAAGGSASWYSNVLLDSPQGQALPGATGKSSLTLAEQAAMVESGAGGLIFLPYIDGERSPIWDPDARGVLFGLNAEHRSPHLARAVLEGVAFSVRHVLETVESAARLNVVALRCVGGPSRVPLWNQIKANVLGRPLQLSREPDASCLGAAILAASGTACYTSVIEATQAMVHLTHEVQPQPDQTAIYDDLFQIYRSLYPRLRHSFAELSAIRPKSRAIGESTGRHDD
jgi:sugar (pentulose or hexulose) kinase